MWIKRHFLISVFVLPFLIYSILQNNERKIYIASWYNYLPQEIINDFEKETGIKVFVHPIDSHESLENKMSFGKHGYDLVVSTIWPNFENDVKNGIYKKVDFQKLNFKIDKNVTHKIKTVSDYAIPFLIGNTGFGFNKTKINPEKFPVQSLKMLFDEETIKKITQHGKIALHDSPVEVFPAILQYLGKDVFSEKIEDLQKANEVLKKISPYIDFFTNSEQTNLLVKEDVIVAQGWSDQILSAKARNPSIEYVVPQEGSFLWIDSFAITKEVMHEEEVYEFLNFIFQEKNIKIIEKKMSIQSCLKVPFKIDHYSRDIKHSKEYENLRTKMWFEKPVK